MAYSAIADLVHHLRNDLSIPQLIRIIHVYSCLVQNPHVTLNVQTICAKMMFNMVDAILAKQTPENAVGILEALVFTCVNKMEALVIIHDEVTSRAERAQRKEEFFDAMDIEKERPFASAAYATESPPDFLRGMSLFQSHIRFFIR